MRGRARPVVTRDGRLLRQGRKRGLGGDSGQFLLARGLEHRAIHGAKRRRTLLILVSIVFGVEKGCHCDEVFGLEIFGVGTDCGGKVFDFFDANAKGDGCLLRVYWVLLVNNRTLRRLRPTDRQFWSQA